MMYVVPLNLTSCWNDTLGLITCSHHVLSCCSSKSQRKGSIRKRGPSLSRTLCTPNDIATVLDVLGKDLLFFYHRIKSQQNPHGWKQQGLSWSTISREDRVSKSTPATWPFSPPYFLSWTLQDESTYGVRGRDL